MLPEAFFPISVHVLPIERRRGADAIKSSSSIPWSERKEHLRCGNIIPGKSCQQELSCLEIAFTFREAQVEKEKPRLEEDLWCMGFSVLLQCVATFMYTLGYCYLMHCLCIMQYYVCSICMVLGYVRQYVGI